MHHIVAVVRVLVGQTRVLVARATHRHGTARGPVDRKQCDAWSLVQNVAHNELWLRHFRRVESHLFVVVFVREVVAHANELLAAIRARQQQHCHSDQIIARDLIEVWRVSLASFVNCRAIGRTGCGCED